MRTWLITGATRGLGLETARAALASGDQVVATGRTVDGLQGMLPDHGDRLLAVPMDVTEDRAITAAINEARTRFGRIDILVNNAGYGLFGAFEEASPDDVSRQFAVNVFGAFAVTRAVLPAMRAQREGRIITISSMAGLSGIDNASLYCATKYAIAGWSESLAAELGRFGIKVTTVYPGMIRTDFLDTSSIRYGQQPIADFAGISAQARERRASFNHLQLGDPRRFGQLLVDLADLANPPVELAVGSDALDRMERKAQDMLANAQSWRHLSLSTDS